jgi:hypothetical protein
MRTMINRASVALGVAAWLSSAPLGWCFYNPQTGRWLNRDPAGEAGGCNAYAFAVNGPTLKFDPDGRLIMDGVLITTPRLLLLDNYQCGFASFRVDFELELLAPDNGWIIQHLRKEVNVTDCADRPVATRNHSFEAFEAWQVIGGVVHQTTQAHSEADPTDHFGFPDEGACRKGTITAIGWVAFVPDYSLLMPPWFWGNGLPTAGLPTAYTPPEGWSDALATEHRLEVTFNCCLPLITPTQRVTTVPTASP